MMTMMMMRAFFAWLFVTCVNLPGDVTAFVVPHSRSSTLSAAWSQNYEADASGDDSSTDTSNTAPPAPASVGDYVKGVHGGKYQFSPVAGFNAAGYEFAQTGYGSESDENENDDELENAPLPRWAQRLGTNLSVDRDRSILRLPGTVTIQNQERTWEPYYVKIINLASEEDEDVTHHFEVQPSRGKLAPRGGAVNPYHPDRPYLDTATIAVAWRDDEDLRKNYCCKKNDSMLLLVIGTEEDQWYYRLEL